MMPFVWQDRLVKIEDGDFIFSKRGDHSNFEYFPRDHTGDIAFCGNVEGKVRDIEIVDDHRLRIFSQGGRFIMHMEDGNADNCRIHSEGCCADIN